MKHQHLATAASKRERRLSELSAPWQWLVRICQWIDYGQILDLQIRDRAPVCDPPPTLLREIKLDADSGGRPESEMADFVLCQEVSRLLDQLEQMHTGHVQRIEVRAGIPRRVFIQATVPEAAR